MKYITFYFAVLGARFLIFDHIHTKPFRAWLCKSGCMAKFLCSCIWCQGFHLGWMLTILLLQCYDIRTMIVNALASGIVCLMYKVSIDPLLSKYEAKYS